MSVLVLDQMLEWLACPVCKHELSKSDERTLRCQVCRQPYPISDAGVPHLLDPERAATLKTLLAKERGGGWNTKTPLPPTLGVRLLRPLVRLLGPPSVSWNVSLGHVSRLLWRQLGDQPSASVLVIGGVRPSDQRYFDFPRRLVLDIAEGPGVQVVGDGQQLPLQDHSVEGVISQAVLEHVEDAEACIREMTRVLRRGGILYCSIPFMQPYHSSPSDFRRYTVVGLEQLFAPAFERLDSGVAAGPGTAMARFCVTFAMSFTDRPWLRRALFLLSSWLCFWLKYLDLFLARKRYAYLMPAAVYFVGVKR